MGDLVKQIKIERAARPILIWWNPLNQTSFSDLHYNKTNVEKQEVNSNTKCCSKLINFLWNVNNDSDVKTFLIQCNL